MNKMRWLNVEECYENSVQKSVYRIINSENEHNFKNYLTKNRNVRNFSQNKLGSHDPEMGRSSYTQKSFLYVAINIYNKLPRNITLIKNPILFKKWLKRFNFDKNVKLREQVDNTISNPVQVINYDIIDRCCTMMGQ